MSSAPADHISWEKIRWARSVLGLAEEASFHEIQNAYRRACKKHHPDLESAEFASKNSDRMREINEAYGILRDYIFHLRVRLTKDAFEDNRFDPERWWRERFGQAFERE